MYLDCQNINFNYTPEKRVLSDVTISLEKGKTLAIVGASGCGKSTLLRILSGILYNNNGNSLQGELKIDELSPDQYRQTGKLAFMFQGATLLPHLTVRQNIELPLKIKGDSNRQKTDNLIEAVGLKEYSNYLPKQLSGGMKTRVALARSFITNPELLLLDEPFSALDIGWRNKLYNELKILAEEFETTLLIVTHNVEEAILLADHIIVLNRLGAIQSRFNVSSSVSSKERVKNITDFMKDPDFVELYSVLQQAIILEDDREKTQINEVKAILIAIYEKVGNETLENQIDRNFTNGIRQFSNEQQINTDLIDIFSKAKTNRLKYLLLWDILEYTELSDKQHSEYFQYYLKNIEEFSSYSRSWYKAESDARFYEILIGRIESTQGYNPKKKWIYICDLYAVKKLPRLKIYIDSLISGKTEKDYTSLVTKAAKVLKEKLKDE
jgi:ABC-type nitrate/sulfonate/bicarbonate transport system ATPase subunit